MFARTPLNRCILRVLLPWTTSLTAAAEKGWSMRLAACRWHTTRVGARGCRRSAQRGLRALCRDAASTARSAPASPRRRRHQSGRRLSCETAPAPYPPSLFPVSYSLCAAAGLLRARVCNGSLAPLSCFARCLALAAARCAAGSSLPLKCRPRHAACSTSATAYPSVPCAVPPIRSLSGPVPPSGRELLRRRGKSSRLFPSLPEPRKVAPAPAGGRHSGCVPSREPSD